MLRQCIRQALGRVLVGRLVLQAGQQRGHGLFDGGSGGRVIDAELLGDVADGDAGEQVVEI